MTLVILYFLEYSLGLELNLPIQINRFLNVNDYGP